MGFCGATPTFFSVSTANPFDSTITLNNTSVINGIPSGTPVTDGLGSGLLKIGWSFRIRQRIM